MKSPTEPKQPSGVPRSDPPLLAGQRAIVTGAGSGIGRGIARALAWHGSEVLAVDLDTGRASAAAAAIRDESDVTVHTGVYNVCKSDEVADLVAAAQAHWPNGITTLVNNVGDWRPNGPFASTTENEWTQLYQLNLEHVFRVTRQFLPGMLGRRHGTIINVSSVEGLRGIPNNAVYAAFKAGVINFTKSVATEAANSGVRVNGIAPDTTHTEQIPVYDWTGEQHAEDIPKWMPLGRFGRPDDHGDVAVFLASELSRFVTGHTIPVDGGTMASAGWYRRNSEQFTNQPRGLR